MTSNDKGCCAPGCCETETLSLGRRAAPRWGDREVSAEVVAQPRVLDAGRPEAVSLDAARPDGARLDGASPDGASPEAVRASVRAQYGAAARLASQGAQASCCSSESASCCGPVDDAWHPITSDLYEAGQVQGVPAEALLASLGCGNPTALAELHTGETVLDLGSGGGIDVLLSARRVGPTGFAYGLDMTGEMLALARENARRAGATNVEFLEGEIEQIPLPNASVDVVISNCVINLSADKGAVLREAYRVLRPGGRFAVSDIVLRGALPDSVRASVALWTGCVAGALHEDEYRTALANAGFEAIGIEPTRVYGASDVRTLLEGASLADEAIAGQVDGKVMSAFVRARKPPAE